MHSLDATTFSRPGEARTGLIRSTEAEDPFLQATSLEQWSQEYTQLSSGPFLGRTVDLSLEAVQLFRETITQAVDERSRRLSDAYTVGVPFHLGGSWQNRPLTNNSLFILPPREEARLRTPPNSDIVVAVIDCAELQRHSEQRLGIDADVFFKGPAVRELHGAVAEDLRAALTRFLLRALDAPGLLDHAHARKSMAEDILGACLRAMDCASERERPSRDGMRVHRAIVEHAREYILSNPADPPTVSDLCTLLNMSRRGLHYAFMQVLDMNPVTFIRNVRLHAVRRVLLRDAASVTTAAQQWGFSHMGMFSCYYKELFGELPSETSRKSPQLKEVRWLCAA